MSLSINSNLYNPCNPNDYKGVSKSNDVNYCAGEKSTKDLNAASGFSGGERLGVTTFEIAYILRRTLKIQQLMTQS